MNDVIIFGSTKQIDSPESLKYCLEGIFQDVGFVEMAARQIISADPQLKMANTLKAVASLLQLMLTNPTEMKIDNSEEKLQELSRFLRQAETSLHQFDARKKENSQAVYWPMPTRTPTSRYEMWPLAEVTPILNLETPIGSAGSCFAREIALVLQKENYNYVVTENLDDRPGVEMAGIIPNEGVSSFSANYGLLFNTPSFRHLAEKAFGERQFSKLLLKQEEPNMYFDPYREDVFFRSPEAYLNEYDKHIEAVRQAFLRSEIFVITLGLNECWQLSDGTFMSRNPKFYFLEFAQHRTLSVAENVNNIQRFYDIIKAHNPKFKLIVTVSPVPFLATGRADKHHVIVANTHSKSVLRVAAEEIVNNNEDAYYFPSYEMVTQCLRDPWEEDDRHVTKDAVSKVMQLFKYQFVEGCTLPDP